MARGGSDPVHMALDRWEGKGLLSPDLASVLREEVQEVGRGETVRWAQFALAATAGAILIIAGATFLAWVWPEMSYGGQSAVLGVIGALVMLGGMRLQGRTRLAPVAYLLQISGPILILLALAYSENAWADATPGGVTAGILGLLLPFFTVGFALGKDPVLGSLQAVLSFLFFFLFLDRALGLGLESSLWILDGMGILGLAWLASRLRDPETPEWTLNVFLGLLYASLFLLFVSGEVIWEMEAMVMVPANLWLLMVAGFSVWALQDSAPPRFQKDLFERQLAYLVLTAIPFAFITVLETLELGANSAALTVACVGAAGLWYSIPRGFRWVLVTSCLALLIAAWYYGAEKAGALGAVLALAAMSALLFWISSRMGRAGSKARRATGGREGLNEGERSHAGDMPGAGGKSDGTGGGG